MEGLATATIITHLIRDGSVKVIGITDATLDVEILQMKRNAWFLTSSTTAFVFVTT